MEFITVEQLKEQPKEVQKVFLDWWKPGICDLYVYNEIPKKYRRVTETDLDEKEYIEEIIDCKNKMEVIPLFTEGQLRGFIEDKYKCLMDIKVENLHDDYNEYTVIGWEINSFDYGSEFGRILFEDCISAKDLLQLYWKVAYSIAKEIVNNNL